MLCVELLRACAEPEYDKEAEPKYGDEVETKHEREALQSHIWRAKAMAIEDAECAKANN